MQLINFSGWVYTPETVTIIKAIDVSFYLPKFPLAPIIITICNKNSSPKICPLIEF